MRRRAIPTILLASILLATVARSGEVSAGGRAFRVPEGLTVERVAGPPLVDRPIVADFDEVGRLYVADSSGSNDPPARQLANPSHRIVRLEDADGDGRYDRSVVFADRMMFPEGAMWRDGSLYVAAPPSIWKLTDLDGDGVADRREEWFKGKTLTGCANDLHGPYDGPDGRIYWCKGAFAEQTVDRPGRSPLKTRAAHVFRARPDGSEVESVMAGGMDNPVELAFSPGGDRFFTTTFLQHPGGGRRDGLIHAIYGGVYGKDHDVVAGHVRTGPDLMPPMTHLGPAAPSGLTRVESAALGEGYRGNLFASLFNLHKVTRHVLEPVGASYRTIDSDFLAADDDLDFHPTDVLEDADGSVLVLDTGGWYKLCCPTSQIGKPDVLGAIYRVRKVGAAKVDDPRGLKLRWDGATADELADRLGDGRHAVRKRAVEAMARLGPGAIGALPRLPGDPDPIEARLAAVQVAARVDHPAARAAARDALIDPDEVVRQLSAHVVGLWRDRAAVDVLKMMLGAGSPRTARAAAEALGRIGDPSVIPALLSFAADAGSDRALEHSMIYAVIEIGQPGPALASMGPEWPSRRRAAMIAVDQMGAEVPPGVLRSALAAGGREAEAADWILSGHPEHASTLVESFRDALRAGVPSAQALARLEGRLARFSRSGPVAELMAGWLRDRSVRPAVRRAVLGAMGRSGLGEMPDSWREALVGPIESGDPDQVRLAVRAAGASKAKAGGRLADALREIAGSGAEPRVRLDALNAIPGGPGALSPALFAFLREQLDPSGPASTRLASADVLVKAKLTGGQLVELAGALRTAGPLESGRLLGAFDRSSDDATGRALVSALGDSTALASIRVEDLRPRFARFPEAVRREAESLYTRIEREAGGRRARLDDLLATLPSGDVRRGQAVFHGPKASCLSCHAIGYLGGVVGPDLTRVGAIRSDRDLLESIVEPSASFVRSFEPTVVATRSGLVHSGIVREDDADGVVLVVAADKEVRIPRADVEAMRPGTVSVMPAGLDRQISKGELADLLAFLRSRR